MAADARVDIPEVLIGSGNSERHDAIVVVVGVGVVDVDMWTWMWIEEVKKKKKPGGGARVHGYIILHLSTCFPQAVQRFGTGRLVGDREATVDMCESEGIYGYMHTDPDPGEKRPIEIVDNV